MTGRRVVIGLSLLLALFTSAFAAQGAFAAKGTTAFTCKPVSTGATFKDEHCTVEGSNSGGSGFVHEEIAPKTSTAITLTNEKTKNETKESTPSVLFVKSFLSTETEISCSTLSSEEGLLEDTAGPPMKVSGTGKILFSGCTVLKPANKCKVKEPIVAEAKAESDIISEAPEEMGIKLSPLTGETFAKIKFEDKSGTEKCSATFKAEEFPVKGSVIATANGEPNGKGATAVVTPAMSSLTLGTAVATLSATGTFRMKEGNPIVLTTTAS